MKAYLMLMSEKEAQRRFYRNEPLEGLSIEKWERIEDYIGNTLDLSIFETADNPKGYHYGASTCALCMEYYFTATPHKGCPIDNITGSACDTSPFSAVRDAIEKKDLKKAIQEAKNMIVFLKEHLQQV